MTSQTQIKPTSPAVLAIDARMLSHTPHGISRYVTSLAKGLFLLRNSTASPNVPARFLYEPLFILPRAMQGKIPDIFFKFKSVESSTPFLNRKELFEIPSLLKKIDAKLYHSPSFSSLLYCPCPWIVTVHDLNHLSFGGIKEKFYYHTLLKSFSKKAKALLTVSEFSRDELSNWLNIEKEKIDVVYNALDDGFTHPLSQDTHIQTLQRFQLKKEGYFFCLSNSKPHKNLKVLDQAYRIFCSQLLSHTPPPKPLIFSSQLGALSDQESQILLTHSQTLFFPSCYEGFGLPPVEAASLGVALVVSDIPPHREALRDLKASEVFWIKPDDREGWTQAFHRAQRGEGVRVSPESQNLIQKRLEP
jgi:glycosyltransferase involved in cell wall biosynthesis